MDIPATTSRAPGNRRIAAALREMANLLELQGANPFRVAAYRRAAGTVESLERELAEIVACEGFDGLTALPHIGHGIAAAVGELLRTGRWAQLDRLHGTVDPVRLFQSIPGIGPRLARSLHETLDGETLEDLEAAAHAGRLGSVPGIGPRREALIRTTLAGMLGRRPRTAPGGPLAPGPSVGLLLDVDREYRERAEAGTLPRIAPRRFNPERLPWLPVLHTRRGRRHFTALFSNTARAHRLGKTGDWVVLYCEDGHRPEEQHTVVTETRGALAGRRVVRGREAECRAYYARQEPSAA